MVRTLGAILIILSCGGFGISLAAAHKAQERAVGELMSALEFMECELQYRCPALPELCAKTAMQCKGTIRSLFKAISINLESQQSYDAESCMSAVLNMFTDLPDIVMKVCVSLAGVLGKFSLDGQMKGFRSVKTECIQTLEELQSHKDARIRSYQTVGVCAGAAVAILFI